MTTVAEEQFDELQTIADEPFDELQTIAEDSPLLESPTIVEPPINQSAQQPDASETPKPASDNDVALDSDEFVETLVEIPIEGLTETLVENGDFLDDDTEVPPVNESSLDRPTDTINESSQQDIATIVEPSETDIPTLVEPTQDQIQTLVEIPIPDLSADAGNAQQDVTTIVEERQDDVPTLAEIPQDQIQTIVEMPIPDLVDAESGQQDIATIVEDPEDVPTIAEVPQEEIATIVETPIDINTDTVTQFSIDEISKRPTQRGYVPEEFPTSDQNIPTMKEPPQARSDDEQAVGEASQAAGDKEERGIGEASTVVRKHDDEQTVINQDYEMPPPSPSESPTDAVDTVDGNVFEGDDEDDSTVQLPFPMDSKGLQRQAKAKTSESAERAIKTKKESTSSSESWRYEIETSVAMGGMGRIYKARDERINRNVAYKVLLPRALERPALVDRFIDEAQITGQLEHPGIVPIYDLGKQRDGSPFYAMKMVHGETLGHAIAEYHQLDVRDEQRSIVFRRLLRNFIDVCNAIAYAHGRGVLHRDLKPQNIMVGGYGETIVLDWGLAKILDPQLISTDSESDPDAIEPDTIHVPPSESETAVVTPVKRATGSMSRSTDTATEMGAVLGTPEFMPPEQARGALAELDFRSDTYSLGGIPYQILTGYTPIPRDKSVKDKLAMVIAGNIKEPRQLNPAIPKPIEAVCLKALSLDRSDRYETAKDLAADVERYLADEPVTAMTDPLLTRLLRWCKRNKTPVVAALSTFVVATVFLVGWKQIEAHRIQSLRADVSQLLQQVKDAEGDQDYEVAEDCLQQADALLNIEDADELVDLKNVHAEIKIRVDNVKTILSKVKQLLADAERAAQNDEFQKAVNLAETAEDAVENRQELKDTHTEVVTKKNAYLALRKESEQRESKKKKYDLFVDLADEARFYGTRFTGESPQELAKTIKQSALEALKVFQLDEDKNVLVDTSYLDEHELTRIRELSFELWLILSDAIRDEAMNFAAEQKAEANIEALHWLNKAAEIGVQSRALSMRRADLLRSLGKTDEAEVAERLANSIEPSTALDHFLLGEMKRKNGEYKTALHFYEQTLDMSPDHFWARSFSGLCNLQLNKFETARHCYERCSKARPGFVWTYLTLAVAESKLGNVDTSLANFAKAENLDNEYYGLYLNRGAVYANRMSEAINEAERKLEGGGGSTVWTEMNPQIVDDYQKAVSDFKKATSLRNDRYRPYFNLGEVHRRMAYWKLQGEQGAVATVESLVQAVDALIRAKDIAPDNANIREVLGNVYWMQENYEGAEFENEEAIELYSRATGVHRAPERIAKCYQQLGGIHFDQGKMGSAKAAFEAAIKTGAHDAKVVAELAQAQLKDKEYAAAEKNFDRYLAMYPSELSSARAKAEVLEARAEARAGLGKFEQAMDDYTRALQIKGYSDKDVLIRRGWSFLNNNFKLAQLDFMRAEKLQKKNPEVQAGLGVTQAMSGQYDEALKSAQRAEKLLDDLDPASIGNLTPNDQATYVWGQRLNIALVYVQIIAKRRIDPKILVPQRISSEQTNQRLATEQLTKAFALAAEQDQIGDALRYFDDDSFFDVVRNAASIKRLVQKYQGSN